MKYRVEGGTAEFGTDLVLILSKEQAAARASSLEPVEGKEDAWLPKRIVQFKAGEVLGVEAEHARLPGKLRMVLVPVRDEGDGAPGGNEAAEGKAPAVAERRPRAQAARGKAS